MGINGERSISGCGIDKKVLETEFRRRREVAYRKSGKCFIEIDSCSLALMAIKESRRGLAYEINVELYRNKHIAARYLRLTQKWIEVNIRESKGKRSVKLELKVKEDGICR